MPQTSLTSTGQIAHPMAIGRARMSKTSKVGPIFLEHAFAFAKNKKTLDQLRVHQRTANVLIMFTHLRR